MEIGLVSCFNRSGNIDFNLSQIEKFCCKGFEKGIDLICFGEAFIQGFDALKWDFDVDRNVAVDVNSSEIFFIRSAASRFSVAISVGFIEFCDGLIYSSNIVIDKSGNVIDIFRRISPGWKEEIASSEYKEGSCFNRFELEGISFSTAICGDLWFEDNIDDITRLNSDVVLWPLYIDYSADEWNNHAVFEYAEQIRKIGVPVLMINNITENGANVGCAVFQNGCIKKKSDMGIESILLFSIK
ncbi:MAG: carbon-nitrogen hydrolase family protein [Candidatus Muirbacterium halophilum]|nr:carbon-nitrogen hydrolase family protein [Candidatus Muirbacterium halophilum]